MRRQALLPIVAAVFLAACYHATIETGRPASPEVLEKSFASSWIYGLVPPSPVSTAARCPNGVAKVETQLSFVNQLVGFLTLGIYTPMSIKVTCASSGSAMLLPDAPEITVANPADESEVRHVLQAAADLAVRLDHPVFVRF
jgi:hypothetical protein